MSFRSDDHNPEGCPGCRPVVFKVGTGKVDERLTALASKPYAAATPEVRKAWHRVTCLNSRDPIDINLCRSLTVAIEQEFKHARV